jgi:predicted adenylyl cyclase CyaB
MQEIEIKFKIDDIEKFKQGLVDKGCTLSEELNQKDIIYLFDLNDTLKGPDKVVVRIRNVNGKSELNLKRKSKIDFQAEEIEFGIEDSNKANMFLLGLGLKEWVTVEKRRVYTKYKNFNICIDDVKRLGTFAEIEIVTDISDKPKYFEKEILVIAKELGIDTNNRINSFYDTMISELDKNL